MFQDLACRLYVAQLSCTYHNATYYILVLSIDRVLAIRFPFKYRVLNFKKVAKLATVGVTVLSLVLPSPFLFLSAFNPQTRGCFTFSRGQFLVFYRYISLFILPGIMLIGCNVIFIRALISRREGGVNTAGPQTTSSSAAAQQRNQRTPEKLQNGRNYVRMLLLTAVSFVALSLVSVSIVSKGLSLRKSSATPSLGKLLIALSTFTFTLNYSINFVFYYASGPMFRTVLQSFSLFSPRPPE